MVETQTSKAPPRRAKNPVKKTIKTPVKKQKSTEIKKLEKIIENSSSSFKLNKPRLPYPIFSKCKEYTRDEFWITIFEELSQGKTPKVIYISGDVIYSSNKRKNFSYPIPQENEKSPEEVFRELKELLINNTSLYSSIDLEQKKKKLIPHYLSNEINDDTTWNEIKKKNLREVFIIKYVIRMKIKHNLTWNSARLLYSTIQLSLECKTHTSKDIIFHKKEIEKIIDIEYDKGKKCFVNNREYEESNEEETNKKYLYLFWDKYVSNFVKTNF